MTWVVAIVVSGLVVDEGATECKESLAGFIQLLSNQGCCNHHTIEVACIMNAASGIVEKLFFEIKIRIVFDANEGKCIEYGVSQRFLLELQQHFS